MENLYHLLYPMRTCLITSSYGGKDNIMAASWVFPLSMVPPLFGVSIAKKRYSYELIQKAGAFGINIPGPELEKVMLVCGRKSGKDSDKFKETSLTKEKGERVVLIKECSASIECKVVREIEAGDHVLFVGEVIKVIKRFDAKGLYHLGGIEFKVV